MTTTLEAAIAKLEDLPEEDQERIGQWLLEELKSEAAWDERFKASGDALKELAEETRRSLREGTATELDPDQL